MHMRPASHDRRSRLSVPQPRDKLCHVHPRQSQIDDDQPRPVLAAQFHGSINVASRDKRNAMPIRRPLRDRRQHQIRTQKYRLHP
jgi:hypothetical protein